MTAEEVAGRLDGMVLLALATATADGRPIVSPVDGVFYRGALHFGSAPDSHLPGEELAVTVATRRPRPSST
jgi:hypothetical protein